MLFCFSLFYDIKRNKNIQLDPIRKSSALIYEIFGNFLCL